MSKQSCSNVQLSSKKKKKICVFIRRKSQYIMTGQNCGFDQQFVPQYVQLSQLKATQVAGTLNKQPTNPLRCVAGKQLQKIDIPAEQTTSVCWGGKNLDELYVTCARVNMTEEQRKGQPLAGSVFKVVGTGSRGLPANVYEG